MIIDVNAGLGSYAFRSLPHSTPEAAIAQMDANGIDRALVVSLPALLYRDAHQGNEELAIAIAAFSRRLVGVAAVNPNYPGWEDDLQRSVQTLGMKAVALHPEHHGYKLQDPAAQAALKQIEQLGVPLVLTQRFEDRRQRHAWDRAEDLVFAEVVAALAPFRTLRVHFSNWIGLDGKRMVDAGLKGRCLIDFARLHVLLRKDVPHLIEHLGVEAIAFGSHAPFDYLGPSLVKLSNLDTFSNDDQAQIAWKNAAAFFRL
ncbi:MAG TPA: hypothetical protein PLN52_09055 [Opitutaceae bacterium]|nr:hypothetical protein [Opitutaceae bacterium]